MSKFAYFESHLKQVHFSHAKWRHTSQNSKISMFLLTKIAYNPWEIPGCILMQN